MSSEKYIPSARKSNVAYCGRDAQGRRQSRCVTCHDATPLADAEPVKGGNGMNLAEEAIFYAIVEVARDAKARLALVEAAVREQTLPAVAWGHGEAERCDTCDVAFLDLAVRCEREHREQQERFATARGPVVLIEYGIPTTCRPRVY